MESTLTVPLPPPLLRLHPPPYTGLNQTGPAGSSLSNPLVAQVQDAVKNGISGVTVNFTANQGAVPPVFRTHGRERLCSDYSAVAHDSYCRYRYSEALSD